MFLNCVNVIAHIIWRFPIWKRIRLLRDYKKWLSYINIFHFLHFCRIHLSIGIKGTVTKIEGNQALYGEIDEIVYSVRVLEVYHDSSDAIQVSTTIDITTPGDSGTCGIDYLTEGVTYLISGGRSWHSAKFCQVVILIAIAVVKHVWMCLPILITVSIKIVLES